MTELKTDPALLDKLRRASSHQASGKELHSQKVSFIMGAVHENSGVTRARIEKALADQEGLKGSS